MWKMSDPSLLHSVLCKTHGLLLEALEGVLIGIDRMWKYDAIMMKT